MIRTEKDISEVIAEDKWMMELLECAQKLNLPDWWICAGFVRSKIWDIIHGFEERTILPDIDVIYYDPTHLEVKEEKKHEEVLNKLLPAIPWSVKNQARMHLVNNVSPYISSVDAISKFPETATTLGVKLDVNDNVQLAAPHGIDDVINTKVKPTPYFRNSEVRMLIYENRVRKKNWQTIWAKVKVLGPGTY